MLVFKQLIVLVAAISTGFSASAMAQSSEPITVRNAQVKLIRNIQIPSREGGVLMKLNFKEGKTVRAGDVIAEVDIDLHSLARDISKLQMEIAELESASDVNKRFAMKSMEVSAAVLARSKKANDRYSKSISQTELAQLRLEAERDVLSLEQAEMQMDVKDVEVDLRRAQLEVDNLKLMHRRITAPWDGLIVETFPQEGEWLNPGQPVVRLIDLSRLRVETVIDSNKYGSDILGKSVSFEVVLPDGEQQTFTGVIDFVSPEIEPITELFIIRAEINNDEYLLRPGSKGTLKIMKN